MASIYKRGKQWWIHYFDTDGTEVQKNLKDLLGYSPRNKSEATLAKKQVEVELAEGRHRRIQDIHLHPFFDEYLAHCQATHSPKTLSRERSIVRYLQKHLPNAPLIQLTTSQLNHILIERREEGIGVHTYNHFVKTMKAAGSYAVLHGYLKEHPAQPLKKL